MERSEINKKFIDKNNFFVFKLVKKLENDNDIAAIVVSSELAHYLTLFTEYCNINNEELFSFNNKRVIIDPYCPSNKLRFVRKSENIVFDVPCICGYFNDEEHGNRLR